MAAPTYYNDSSRINSMLKRVYGGVLQNVVPNNLEFLFNDFKFAPAQERLGDKYVEAFLMATEAGISEASATSGVITLANPVAPTVVQALVDGNQTFGQAWLEWGMLAKAQEAVTANSKQAFEKATKMVMEGLVLGMRRRLATTLLYAGSSTGIGKVASVSTNTLTITQATFAPGIFAYSDNMQIDIWDPTFTTQRTNATTVTGWYVDSTSTPTVTVDNATGVLANDIIVPRGWYAGGTLQLSPGLSGIADSATSLFGVSQTTYPGFKANVIDNASAPLTQSVFDNAVLPALYKGLDSPLKAYIHPQNWANLNIELTSRVKQVDYERTIEAGADTIKYRTQAGPITVVASPWIKRGEAYIFPTDGSLRRIGAADLKLGDPGNEDLVLRRVENKNAYSIVAYSFQSLFTSKPMFITKIINIA